MKNRSTLSIHVRVFETKLCRYKLIWHAEHTGFSNLFAGVGCPAAHSPSLHLQSPFNSSTAQSLSIQNRTRAATDMIINFPCDVPQTIYLFCLRKCLHPPQILPKYKYILPHTPHLPFLNFLNEY